MKVGALMTFSRLARRAALALPRVRRFYDYARATQAELVSARALIESLAQDKSRLARELEQAQTALNAALGEREALSRNLDQDRARLARELEQAQASLQSAIKEREELSRNLYQDKARLARELEQAQASLQSAMKEREELSRNFDRDKTRLARELEQAQAALQFALKDREALFRSLDEDKAKLAGELEQAKAALQSVTKDRETFSRQVEEENSRLARELRMAQASLQSGIREREALWSELNEALKAQAASKDREDLELQNYVLRSDLNRSVNSIEELRTSLQKAEGALAEVDKVTQALREREEAETLWQAEKADLEQKVAEALNMAQLLGEGEARWLSTVESFEQAQAVWSAEKAEMERRVAEAEQVRDAAQLQADTLQHGQHTAVREFANHALAAQVATFTADLETHSSRLLTRLSLMSSDLKDLKRLSRAGDGHIGDQALTALRQLYLDLLEKALIGSIYQDAPISPWSKGGFETDVRLMGRDWPSNAHTMIGAARMRNVRFAVESIIADQIPGDLIEAGVWRGGACIYMRGILAAYEVPNRKVWVADSFVGLPPPDPTLYPADAGDLHHQQEALAISLEQVRSHFDRYDLLDDQVVFVPGWFNDTLPSLPVEKLALLRLDGDMYQSTMETLEALYAKVSVGGYIIVDDYILGPCKQAIHDFRARYDVHEPIEAIDGAGVYWRKQTEVRSQDIRPAAQNGSKWEGSKAVARHASA